MSFPLPETSRVHFKSGPATIANLRLAEPGAYITSPTSGAVVRWRLAGNSLGGPFALRVLRPAGKGQEGRQKYKKVGVTPGVYANGFPQTIPASLPIQKGDLIALDVPGDPSAIGFAMVQGSEGYSGLWSDGTGEAEDATVIFDFSIPGWEYGFNADVQPPPTIQWLSPPASGSVIGGTTVVLHGADFEEATSVMFGEFSAQSFSVNSPSQINAVSPPSESLAKVPITVVTPGGSTTSSGEFTYRGCVVPDIRHRQLRVARKLIKVHRCSMGHIRKRGPAKSKLARVVSQRPPPGAVVAPGAKVSLTLSRPRG
jgi:hypothetical protein